MFKSVLLNIDFLANCSILSASSGLKFHRKRFFNPKARRSRVYYLVLIFIYVPHTQDSISYVLVDTYVIIYKLHIINLSKKKHIIPVGSSYKKGYSVYTLYNIHALGIRKYYIPCFFFVQILN